MKVRLQLRWGIASNPKAISPKQSNIFKKRKPQDADH